MKEQVVNGSAESLANLRERTMRLSKAAAKAIDEQAHDKVWTFVSLAAVASILGGYIFGRWVGGRQPLK